MRTDKLVHVVWLWLVSCGGASTSSSMPAAASPSTSGPAVGSASPAAAVAPTFAGSELSDQAPVGFRDVFAGHELGTPWNIFGALGGNREVKGGPDGVWIKIADGERPWDAVGARTSRVKVDGDFDLRGRFRNFSAAGNGSAKLIVVDAANPRGEAAYVERIQIDGKNLFKFGGEVDGSLENWGFAPTDVDRGDLRLVRKDGMLHAYSRVDERSPWNEFARAQKAPRSMPKVVKVGMKLSADAHKSAQVRWVEVTLDGQVIRTE